MTATRREARTEPTAAPPESTLGIPAECFRGPLLWAATVLVSRETPTWSQALAAAAILHGFTRGRC